MSDTPPAHEDAVIVLPGDTQQPPRSPGSRRTGYKPSRAERLERTARIYDLRVAGATRTDISRYLAKETTWELSDRTIDRYIAVADTIFAKLASFHRQVELGKAIARLTDLYARSNRIQDYKTALAAQKELNDLLGLHAPRALALDPDDPSAGGFVAVVPMRHKSQDEWEHDCKAEQQAILEQRARTPKVIASTNSAAP